MKLILKLLGLLLLFSIQTKIFAQSAAQKRVLVYFKTGVQRNAPPNQNTVTITSSNVTQILNNYGLNVSNVTSAFPNFNEADTVNSVFGEDSRQMDYARVFTISLPDTSFKAALINSLQQLSEVLYTESDGDVTSNIIPVDGQFGQQWNLRNTIVPNADIHAEHAWDIFTGNPNSIIAIIDAGVDVNHNDLTAKIDGGDNTFFIQHDPIIGDFSHGSHVAGIAAAVTNNNNNNGVAGVDWQARIHPWNVINPNSSDAQVTQAINESINFSPNVWTLNNSWGSLPVGRYSVTVRSAFANAYRNNRVSCIAMGNHQQTNPDAPSFPADINSGVIAVGATDDHDNIANFSAHGLHIDVSAPGVDITSTNFNNDYIALSGTSMATPHVSGLASLLKGFNTNLANDDIEQIIRLTADDRGAIGFDNQYGTGRINAERALQSLQAPNQLFHYSSTGGTVFNTLGNQTRIFLGVPGFADAAYIVKRSEIRTNVIFPAAMCTMIGAWGRGVGTTGYREEQGRCFGEGICEIVPGTLTNNGATLRTWIYEVWGINGQYYGFFPRSANNVIFQYTVLGVPLPSSITGADAFCTSESYSLNIAAPAGATVTWSVSPRNSVLLNPTTGNSTTVTKRNGGNFTLTATITDACGSNPIIIQRHLLAGPPPITILGPYDPIEHTVMGVACVGQEYYFVASDIETGQSYTWTLFPPPGSNDFPTLYSGTPVYITFNETGYYTLRVEKTNSCGSSHTDMLINAQDCVDNFGFIVSPNPSSGNIQITATNDKTYIKEIRVNDKTGIVKKRFVYNLKNKSVSINISSLPADVYYLQIFDGIKWVGRSIIKK
jgi:subtilisin family serine protease